MNKRRCVLGVLIAKFRIKLNDFQYLLAHILFLISSIVSVSAPLAVAALPIAILIGRHCIVLYCNKYLWVNHWNCLHKYFFFCFLSLLKSQRPHWNEIVPLRPYFTSVYYTAVWIVFFFFLFFVFGYISGFKWWFILCVDSKILQQYYNGGPTGAK